MSFTYFEMRNEIIASNTSWDSLDLRVIQSKLRNIVFDIPETRERKQNVNINSNCQQF